MAFVLAAGSARAQSVMMESTHDPANAAATTLASGTSLDALRAREVVMASLETEGIAVHTGYAAVIIRRPPTEVLAAIHDVDHYRDFIPQFEQSHELSHGASTQDLFVRIALRPIASLWARLHYHEVTLATGAVEIDGRALQGNVRRMDVRWRLTPLEDGAATALEFWSLVVPAFPVPIPTSVLDREEESAARRGVEAVRARVEGTAVRASDGERER